MHFDEARNDTTVAISFLELPYLPIGISFLNCSFSGKESIKPGKILFIRIFFGAYSSANNFVKLANPALIAPEVGKVGLGSKVAKVEILIMENLKKFWRDY